MMTGKEQGPRRSSNVNPLLHKESRDNLIVPKICMAHSNSDKKTHPTLQLGTVTSLTTNYHV
jgi:hypothetical protein